MVVVVGVGVGVRRRIVLGVAAEQTVALLSEVAEAFPVLLALVLILFVEWAAFQIPLEMAK